MLILLSLSLLLLFSCSVCFFFCFPLSMEAVWFLAWCQFPCLFVFIIFPYSVCLFGVFFFLFLVFLLSMEAVWMVARCQFCLLFSSSFLAWFGCFFKIIILYIYIYTYCCFPFVHGSCLDILYPIFQLILILQPTCLLLWFCTVLLSHLMMIMLSVHWGFGQFCVWWNNNRVFEQCGSNSSNIGQTGLATHRRLGLH